jgi:hypothetical protein
VSETPDFAALRAQRDAELQAFVQKIADEHGVPLTAIRMHVRLGGCYCDCASGGPCEHRWDGGWTEFDDGHGGTATCSLCGCSAFSHDLRNAP